MISTPTLRGLARLVDDVGLVEHADGAVAAPRFGYCTDDAGRALVLVTRLPADPLAPAIAARAVAFLRRCQQTDGTFVLRLGPDGRPTGHPPSDDAWGRAMWGVAAATSVPWPDIACSASELFVTGSQHKSSYPRAAAHAVVAAATVLARDPSHPPARRLLDANLPAVPRTGRHRCWPWPEPRLTYANALIPEAMMAGGHAAGDDETLGEGLDLLGWLVHHELAASGRFSFTPTRGAGPGERVPGGAFDQQPIEAWTMAEACARAFDLTGEPRWAALVGAAAGWFDGDNDAGAVMWDTTSGGGYDGLHAGGVNGNQGCESTLALIATCYLAWRATAARAAGEARSSTR